MQCTHASFLSHMLSSNLYGPALAQLQRQREVGAFGSGAMELDRPGAPAHAHLLSATAKVMSIENEPLSGFAGPDLQEQQAAERPKNYAGHSAVHHITCHRQRGLLIALAIRLTLTWQLFAISIWLPVCIFCSPALAQLVVGAVNRAVQLHQGLPDDRLVPADAHHTSGATIESTGLPRHSIIMTHMTSNLLRHIKKLSSSSELGHEYEKYPDSR